MTIRSRCRFALLLLLAVPACGRSGGPGAPGGNVPPGVRWAFDTGGCVASSPTVVGDAVAAGSCTGSFFLLDPATGAVKWKYDTRSDGQDTQFHHDPLAAGDLVLIGVDAKGPGHLYAFETATGAVRWKHQAGVDAEGRGGVAADLARIGDGIYAVGLDGKLFCLDRATGRSSWSFEGAAPRSAPAAGPGRLYVAGSESKVYSLDAATGQVVWETEVEGRVTTSLALQGEDLYLGASPFRIYRLEAGTGRILGSFPLQQKPILTPVVTADALLVFVGTPGEEGESETLIAVDRGLGRILWGRKAPSAWRSRRPGVWQDLVIAADREGELFAFGAADGTRRWSARFGESLHSVGVSPKALYVGTTKGPIYSFVPDAGAAASP